MRIVGRRRTDRDIPGALQRTMAELRGTHAVVPRGVYRFRSFEEADAWMTRTMARTHASLKSKTSSESAARWTTPALVGLKPSKSRRPWSESARFVRR